MLIGVNTFVWNEKADSNAISLIEIGEAYISTENFKIQFNFDLNILYSALNDIQIDKKTINQYCSLNTTNACKRVTQKLKAHTDRIEARISTLCKKPNSTYNTSPSEEKSKLNFIKLLEASVSLKYIITSDMIHFTIESNILDIQNLDSLLTSIENQLKTGDIYSFFNIISEHKFKETIEKIHENLSENETLPTRKSNTTFDYDEYKQNIFKTMAISSVIERNVMKIKVLIPIVERNKYKIHKIKLIPIQVGNSTLILNSQLKYVLESHNKQFWPIKNAEMENATIIDNSIRLISYKPNRSGDTCETSIIMETINNDNIESCTFDEIPHKNYIVKLNENTYQAYILTPILIEETCGDNSTKFETKEVSGILKLTSYCNLKIHEERIEYEILQTNDRTHRILTTNQLNKFMSNQLNKNGDAYIHKNRHKFIHLVKNNEGYNNIIIKTQNAMESNCNEMDNTGNTIMLYGLAMTVVLSVLLSTVITIVITYASYKKIFNTQTMIKITEKIIKKLETQKKK